MKIDDLIAQILNDEGEDFLTNLGREIRRRGYLDNPDLRPEHIFIEVEEDPVLDDMWYFEINSVDGEINITRFFPLSNSSKNATTMSVLNLLQEHYWEISAYIPMRGSTRIVMKRVGHRGDNRAFDLFKQMGRE